MRYDLHTHSHHSTDGYASPKALIRAAKRKGLDGIAITDHNTIRGGLEGLSYATDGFRVVVGAEISTERGEVMGLFLSEEIHSRAYEEVVHHIDDQGGLVVVPHPFDTSRSSSLRITKKDTNSIGAIETCNARCVRRQYDEEARAFANQHNIPQTGGSDAHFLQEIGRAGVMTECESIRDAIERRDCRVFANVTTVMTYVYHSCTKGLKLRRGLGRRSSG
jgi:predicted metal-dependent phosphoesterase TrpH